MADSSWTHLFHCSEVALGHREHGIICFEGNSRDEDTNYPIDLIITDFGPNPWHCKFDLRQLYSWMEEALGFRPRTLQDLPSWIRAALQRPGGIELVNMGDGGAAGAAPSSHSDAHVVATYVAPEGGSARLRFPPTGALQRCTGPEGWTYNSAVAFCLLDEVRQRGAEASAAAAAAAESQQLLAEAQEDIRRLTDRLEGFEARTGIASGRSSGARAAGSGATSKSVKLADGVGPSQGAAAASQPADAAPPTGGPRSFQAVEVIQVPNATSVAGASGSAAAANPPGAARPAAAAAKEQPEYAALLLGQARPGARGRGRWPAGR